MEKRIFIPDQTLNRDITLMLLENVAHTLATKWRNLELRRDIKPQKLVNPNT